MNCRHWKNEISTILSRIVEEEKNKIKGKTANKQPTTFQLIFFLFAS